MSARWRWVRVFLLGLCEGVAEPYGVTFGMTYDDEALSDAYDRGANVGESIGRAWVSCVEVAGLVRRGGR